MTQFKAARFCSINSNGLIMNRKIVFKDNCARRLIPAKALNGGGYDSRQMPRIQLMLTSDDLFGSRRGSAQ